MRLRRGPSARRSSPTVTRASPRQCDRTFPPCSRCIFAYTLTAHERASNPTVTPATLRLRVIFATSATNACASTKNGVGQMAARNNGRGFGRRDGTCVPGAFLERARPGAGATRRVGGARLTILAATALALTGCATPRVATIYCLDKTTQLPTEPPKVKGQLTGEADKDLRIVAGSALRLRAWGQGLQTVLEGCREPSR